MGCGNSSRAKPRKLTPDEEKKLKKIEAKLFIKVMKYDINMGFEPELPIEG